MSVDQEKKLIVRNHFYDKGKAGDYFALQPIYDAIGHQFVSKLGVKDKITICEGVTDMLYIWAFCKLLNKSRPNLAPARGDGQIAHLLSFMIAQGFRCKILIDKGAVRKKLQTDYGIEDKFIYEIPIPLGFDEALERTGVEDLFTKADFAKVLQLADLEVGPGLRKTTNSNYVKSQAGNSIKRILAHTFFSKVGKVTRKNFEDETLNSFERVLNFCSTQDWFSI